MECTDPASEATVVQINFAEDTTSGGEYRYDGTVDEIDFFLDLDARQPIEAASTGKGRQFACMQTTKGPHADEPGGGKTPIVAGDCFHPGKPVKNGLLETQYVGEIRCAQADVLPPAYKVTAIGKGITGFDQWRDGLRLQDLTVIRYPAFRRRIAPQTIKPFGSPTKIHFIGRR